MSLHLLFVTDLPVCGGGGGGGGGDWVCGTKLLRIYTMFSVGALPNLSFGILSAPVHLYPRCHTGVSRVWGHTGRGWGPQEETGSTEDQRQIWKLWNGPAVCCNVYSYSHTPFSTVHHCLCV